MIIPKNTVSNELSKHMLFSKLNCFQAFNYENNFSASLTLNLLHNNMFPTVHGVMGVKSICDGNLVVIKNVCGQHLTVYD